ncbi:MAG: arylsulfotransferase family protein [Solirubrobacteraceae bacterium]
MARRLGSRPARLALLAALALPCLGVSPAWGAVHVALSPLNGTPDASPSTQISFLGVPASQIADVSVVGSRTGRHSGHLKAYKSSPGASFLPERPFSQGETVTAGALVGPRGHAREVRSTFTVATLSDYSIETAKPLELSRTGLVQSFQSQPGLKPPVVWVTAGAGSPQGEILMTPTHGFGQSGPMIVDSQGRLVWFHPAPRGDEAMDLQEQSLYGKPVLTWWEGKVAADLGVGFGRDEIVNSAYKFIGSVGAGNGYQADLHEFQITPRGSAFLTAYSLVSADLSSVGGLKHGILQDAILQEIDIPTGLVMFEWHAYGHVSLSDSYAPVPHYENRPWDFFHMNSISPDTWGDGNFIVSSRNTWAAYEIDHLSGAVLWRLGGRRSSFEMGPGTGTAWQHDVRWQSDHTLTIFDNGASPPVHSESRVIRERIDWAHRKVTLVSRYSGRIMAGSQGDDESLSGGGSFVGWGEAPYMTEFSPAGQVLFSAHFPAPGQSYRTYLAPWSATPEHAPAIAVRAGSPSGTTLYASWNGATGVSAWRVLAGESASSLEAVQTVPSSGFETAIAVGGAGPYLAVQALGAAGQVLGTSQAKPL